MRRGTSLGRSGCKVAPRALRILLCPCLLYTSTGKAVFYQNGSWAYADLTKAGMTDDQIGMMPIYIGVDGEENQGLCSGLSLIHI